MLLRNKVSRLLVHNLWGKKWKYSIVKKFFLGGGGIEFQIND